MDNLAEIIKQAEADVQEQETLLASAQARVAVAQADEAAARDKLEKAHIVLEWLTQRSQGQAEAPPEKQADEPKPKPQMRFGRPVPEGDSKLNKILEALIVLGGAASNKQISSHVDMSPDHVRGLLKYASGKSDPPVATEPGSGVWRLTRSPNGTVAAQ